MLKVVEHNSFGARFGLVSKLRQTIDETSEHRILEDVSDAEIEAELKSLEESGYIERKEIKGRGYVGLAFHLL